MANPIPVLFLMAIPEMIAFSLLVVVITKDLKNWKKAIFVGVVLAVALHFIRMLPIAFGVHTSLAMILAVTLYKIALDTDLAMVMKAVIIGTLLIALGEFLFYLLSIGFVGLAFEEIGNSIFWRIVLGYFPIVFLILGTTYLLFRKKNKK